ncbi:hypothetical protein CLOM_g16432, partial [Closterium sp. NIES-68]
NASAIPTFLALSDSVGF